jgi:flap endonuclease-1
MGVKNLYKIIQKYANDVPKKYPLTHYAGKKIIIDASIYMYKWSHINVPGKTQVGGKPARINHIQGIFYQASALILAGIEPTYAFDGAPSAAKSATIAARQAKIERMRLPHGAAKDCQDVLRLLGVSYFIADGEAETTAAAMIARDEAYGIISEDTDCLVYPRAILLRMVTEKNKQYLIEYNHNDIARGLGLTSEQFINLCVMLGTDYNASILPPKRAISAAMDPLIESSDILKDENAMTALDIFNLHNGPLNVNIQTQGCYDRENLQLWLINIGMVPNRIDNTLNKLSEKLGAKIGAGVGANDIVSNTCNSSITNYITQNLHIHGISGCEYFADAIKLAPNATIVEIPGPQWSAHVAALNDTLGTNYALSPYIFAADGDKKIFIGSYDNFKMLLGGC